MTSLSEAEPLAPATDNTPFHRLGGHEVIQTVVDRFYDLMDTDPAYAELRALHAPDLAPMRQGLALFLAAWTGGPRDWFDQNPGRCMMSVHRPYTITRELADQWADAMQRAAADVAPGDGGMVQAMGGALADLARNMARD